ncbi:hypothetical protein BASA60_001248 [Batrachochytrium salamandrivorans]|nr:hypothetical protein BASA60_001248 [Batrachochytrium salamandrivorans]
MFNKSDLRPSSTSAHEISSAGTNTYIRLGTQQPEAATDVKAKERNKYLPVHLQEVRDEHGRKRLHGAFTGGYSAGYYNTVGSKEGWQPSQFVSSRAKRAQLDKVNPQDFMDEDDKQEFGFRDLVATDTYDVQGAKERDQKRRGDVAKSLMDQDGYGEIGSATGRIIQDLILPAESSIGDKLMRQMGWREGQGIGPRHKRKIVDDEGVDTYAEKFLFAPKDTLISYAHAKTNMFGIGFDPYTHAPEFAHLKKENRTDGVNIRTKQGFGVGIFEDEDDIDVYDRPARPDMLLSVIDDDQHGNPKMSDAHRHTNRGGMDTRANIHLKNSSGVSPLLQYSSNTTSIAGFHVARVPLVEPKRFSPPKPPSGYIPKCPFLDQLATSEHDMGHASKSVAPGQHKNLTADQRRVILGGSSAEEPARSVFSYISVKSQDKLQDILDQTSRSKFESAKKEHDEEVLHVPKDVALAALKGFMPFGNTLDKQDRYRRFLQVKAGLETTLSAPLPSQTARDISHEILEFSKAAMIYRPLSSMMASRFTSAVDQSGMSHSNNSKTIQANQPTVPKVIYGIKTRNVCEWRPERLLCKRFNVPVPIPDITNRVLGSKSISHRAFSDSIMTELRDEAYLHNSKGSAGSLVADMPKSVDEARIPEVSPQQPEVLLREPAGILNAPVLLASADTDKDDLEMVERPSIDIFKAIFANSDDESDDSDDEEVAASDVNISKADCITSDTSLELSKKPPSSSPVISEIAAVSSEPGPTRLDSTSESVRLVSSIAASPAVVRPVFRSKTLRSSKLESSIASSVPLGSAKRLRKTLVRPGLCMDDEEDQETEMDRPVRVHATTTDEIISVVPTLTKGIDLLVDSKTLSALDESVHVANSTLRGNGVKPLSTSTNDKRLVMHVGNETALIGAESRSTITHLLSQNIIAESSLNTKDSDVESDMNSGHLDVYGPRPPSVDQLMVDGDSKATRDSGGGMNESLSDHSLDESIWVAKPSSSKKSSKKERKEKSSKKHKKHRSRNRSCDSDLDCEKKVNKKDSHKSKRQCLDGSKSNSHDGDDAFRLAAPKTTIESVSVPRPSRASADDFM